MCPVKENSDWSEISLGDLSRAELNEFISHKEEGSDSNIAAKRELARRVRNDENDSKGPAPSTENGHPHAKGDSKGPHGLSWSPPIPLVGNETPASLPTGVLPDWIQAFVETISESVQVARDLPVLLSLSVLAGALQKKVEVEVRRGWVEPLTVWAAALLASGERKSPTYRLLTKPIQDHEQHLMEESEAAHLEAKDLREVLEKRLKNAKMEAAKAGNQKERKAAEMEVREAREDLEKHHVPPLPQLWIDDATSEALLQLLNRHHGRMLAMSPEGDIFKFMAGRYSSGNGVLNVYKKSWTGDEALRDDRVTREGYDVPNPALSIGICAQPQVLQDLAKKDTFRGEGLIARFLYAVPTPKAGYRITGEAVPALDTDAQAHYNERLTELLRLDPKSIEDGDYVPHTLQLSDEAKRVLWAFQEEVENMLRPGGHLDGLQDWGNKLVGQTIRIAGLLHVAETGELDTKLSKDILQRATRLGRALISHAKAAYELLNANDKTRLAKYIWRRICTVAGLTRVPNIPTIPENRWRTWDRSDLRDSWDNGDVGPLSKSDLWQATKSKSDIGEVDDLTEPLNQLEEHNLIKIVEQSTEGRGRNPSPLIYLNPLVASE